MAPASREAVDERAGLANVHVFHRGQVNLAGFGFQVNDLAPDHPPVS